MKARFVYSSGEIEDKEFKGSLERLAIGVRPQVDPFAPLNLIHFEYEFTDQAGVAVYLECGGKAEQPAEVAKR